MKKDGNMEGGQGDQIFGKLFSLGSFLKIMYMSSAYFWATLFHGKCYALILTKNGLSYILGDVFTNSSGHPEGVTTWRCKIHKVDRNLVF
jgi:hypothetical protein